MYPRERGRASRRIDPKMSTTETPTLRTAKLSGARHAALLTAFFDTVTEYLAQMATMTRQEIALHTGPAGRISMATPPLLMTMTLKMRDEVVTWQGDRLFTAPTDLALVMVSASELARADQARHAFTYMAARHGMTDRLADVDVLRPGHAPVPEEMWRGVITLSDPEPGMVRPHQVMGWVEVARS